MNRLAIIQKVIDATNASSYLEIGVETGEVLLNINAPLKYGVDPQFKFQREVELQVKQFHANAMLYEMTSDSFFEDYAASDLNNGLDVAFVDGLHTYKQALKDIENCLRYLNNGGIILVHDCSPLNFASAFPVKESVDELIHLIREWEIPGWNGYWNGDVWKALVHLRIEHDDLNIFTLDLDWGVGVISRGDADKLQGISLRELEAADYGFLERDRARLLNLKHPKYIKDFLRDIKNVDTVSN